MQRIAPPARNASAALTSASSRWPNSALRAAASKPAGDPHAAGSITFCIKKGGGTMQRIVLLAFAPSERCPHLGIEPLAEQRLACCSIKASGDPHAAGSITFCIKKGGGGQCSALCC